jgi:hypothetical protein
MKITATQTIKYGKEFFSPGATLDVPNDVAASLIESGAAAAASSVGPTEAEKAAAEKAAAEKAEAEKAAAETEAEKSKDKTKK